MYFVGSQYSQQAKATLGQSQNTVNPFKKNPVAFWATAGNSGRIFNIISDSALAICSHG
jgi:hypothetical protein